MIEILLLVMALLGMAKKSPRRRRQANFGALPQSIAITLSTLNDDTVIVQGTETILTQDFNMKSVDVVATLRDNTAGEGPIYFGIAASEYTVGEILEALKASPTSQQDVPAVEHAARKVRTIGAFKSTDAATKSVTLGKRRVKLWQRTPAGKALPSFWAWNRSGAALQTGSIIQIEAVYYGNWQ